MVAVEAVSVVEAEGEGVDRLVVATAEAKEAVARVARTVMVTVATEVENLGQVGRLAGRVVVAAQLRCETQAPHSRYHQRPGP